MGIIFSNAALLARARESGVRFDRILTIGHQNLYLTANQIRQLGIRFGRTLDGPVLAREQYADNLFRQLLDAQQVVSLDYSNYEGCDVVHDLNQPVDASLQEQFDVVIDGGTLEHIFNFPVAIANYMSMVRTGGSLFLFTMANNHAGHGFYQFSPELFFRIFQPDNGFEVRDVILELHSFPGAELSHRTTCYSVVDPAIIRTRVGLVSKSPVMMMVHAVKTAHVPVFRTPPLQSDYAHLYDGGSTSSPPAGGLVALLKSVARTCLKAFPPQVKQYIDGKRQLWHYSIHNRRFYKRWYPL